MNAAEHNHPPRCCCPVYQVAPDDHDYEARGGRLETEKCPACPEHGDLAPPIECPQCHQPIGRPHTEFCTLAPDRVWPVRDGQLWMHRHPDGQNWIHPADHTCEHGEPPPDPMCGHPDWPDCPHPQHQRPLQ